jgi:hypothetical protein
MSNGKKERVMSPKGFLHKATTKAANSAEGFLAQHRAWLETGDLAQFTSPILRKLDEKEILPTPALEAIKVIVLDHMIASEIRKGEEAIDKRENGAPVTPKNWTVTIYTSKGDEVQSKGFELAQEADRWADRRLFEGASDWYAVVNHATLLNKNGELLNTVILRNDAMARLFKQARGPVMKPKPTSGGKLSFGVKCGNDVAKFSHG